MSDEDKSSEKQQGPAQDEANNELNQDSESQEKVEDKEVLEKEEDAPEPVPEKTVVSPFLVVLLIVNFLFVFFIYFNQKKIDSIVNKTIKENETLDNINSYEFKLHGNTKVKENHIAETLEFKNLQVNFKKTPGPKRYLALSFTLIIETPEDSPLNETNGLRAKINDRIFSMTNKLTHIELLSLQGREIYKQLLIKNVNQLLNKDKVIKVLYQKFLVR